MFCLLFSTYVHILQFFNREECDRVIEIINSRVVDYTMGDVGTSKIMRNMKVSNITVAFFLEFGYMNMMLYFVNRESRYSQPSNHGSKKSDYKKHGWIKFKVRHGKSHSWLQICYNNTKC